MPKKRLVLTLDGTWNKAEDNTNVWRVCQLVAPMAADGLQQIVYYTPGVGTARGERIRGGSLGYGLDRDVVSAYRWLMGHFEPGDDIFLFGFSRGAYTARSLAGMIVRCGLLRPGSPLSVAELYQHYRLDDRAPTLVDLLEKKRKAEKKGLPPSSVLTAEEWRLVNHSRRVTIMMIGVWDTVGALGVPFGNFPGISRRRFRFHNMRLSTTFRHAYHALAIDEHRQAFTPTLWDKFIPAVPPYPRKKTAKPSVVEQRWFAGAHANVGGGIAGDDMSQMPLVWLMEKAGELGLTYRREIEKLKRWGPEPVGRINDSFSGFLYRLYPVVKFGARYLREIAAPPVAVKGGRLATVNETIDASVFRRWSADPLYRPLNLAHWASRKKVDPANLFSSVDARTGKPIDRQ